MKPTVKQVIGGVVILVVVAGTSFYAGTAYAASSRGAGRQGPAEFSNGSRGGFQGPMMGQQSGIGAGMRGGFGQGGMTAGTIVSKDADSVTVALASGGSAVVFLNGTTTVLKSTAATTGDLETGQTVVVTGAKSADGSVTASTIQIRPAGQGGAGNVGAR